MDIVEEYFKYRKNYILEYCNLLSKNIQSELKEYYLKKYIDNYVEAYYCENFETIDYKDYHKVNIKDLNIELKGKYYELVYELEKKRTVSNKEKKLIAYCHTFTTLAVLVDLQDYSKCETIKDYESIIRKVFDSKKEMISISESMLNELVRLVKKNTVTTRNYLNSLVTNEFKLHIDEYEDTEFRKHVIVKQRIEAMRSYKKIVATKVFDSKIVFRQKLKLELNLLNIELLKNILARKESDYYFVDIKLGYLNKFILSDIQKIMNNSVAKKHVIFLLDFKEYSANKSSIKPLNGYLFGAYVDMTNIKDVTTKLDTFILDKTFNYIIIDNIKKTDERKLKNYTIDGKEIIINNYRIKRREG